jgi:FixJ family two-component response regulator
MLSISPESRERNSALSAPRPVVYLVHTDRRLRQSMLESLAPYAFDVLGFGSAREYFAHARLDALACLILGLQLPDINGLELQQQLSRELGPPIIFISDHTDIKCTVRAIKAGAIEFLNRPVDLNALLNAIELAITEDARARARNAHLANLRGRFTLLTPREREVFPLVISGLRNKQAAWALGITAVTLQIHRGQIMRKMAAPSFAELVRMGSHLNLTHLCEPTRTNRSASSPISG